LAGHAEKLQTKIGLVRQEFREKLPSPIPFFGF
jgi:hypothetical protein